MNRLYNILVDEYMNAATHMLLARICFSLFDDRPAKS